MLQAVRRRGTNPGSMPRRRLPPLTLLGLLIVLLGGPLLVPHPDASPRPDHGAAGAPGRFEQVLGLDVHHEVAGPADAPAVLLHHHFYGNTRTWRHVTDGLADDWRTIAFDRPGFGLTERPSRSEWQQTNPYTRAASARIGLGLLDTHGAEQAVVVGASAGGTIALETYAAAPERVKALVLISPAITADVGPSAALRPLLRSAPARRLGPYAVRRRASDISLERITRSWHDPARADVEDLEAYRAALSVDGWDRGFWEVITAESPPDLRDVLFGIDVPTLVVVGEHDSVISPRLNAKTAKAIPGARFEVLPDCGHTPHEECPEALLEVVTDFLDGV
jgi:pimeloyl-ACP methyl ester carboxylesterase